MQLIAEAASLCRELGGLSADDVASLFRRLNDGPLAGFLMETTAKVQPAPPPTRSLPPLFKAFLRAACERAPPLMPRVCYRCT